MSRDPRTDPREGDVLRQAGGAKELHVDMVCADEVLYRVIGGAGGLLAVYRVSLAYWREHAPHVCCACEDEEE